MTCNIIHRSMTHYVNGPIQFCHAIFLKEPQISTNKIIKLFIFFINEIFQFLRLCNSCTQPSNLEENKRNKTRKYNRSPILFQMEKATPYISFLLNYKQFSLYVNKFVVSYI